MNNTKLTLKKGKAGPMRNRFFTLGIDPGSKGAFVLLDEAGQIVRLETFPTVAAKLNPHALWRELKTVIDWVQELQGSLNHLTAYVEDVHAIPGTGAGSCFMFGTGCGWLEMALIALGVRYEKVRPKEWQKLAHASISKGAYENPKDRSLLVAQRLWPSEGFLGTARSKKPHDGLIDAALIAWYGLNRNDAGAAAKTAS